MAPKPLKVGFDLDGVILYNPVRVLRPISAFLSKILFHKKTTSFYIPKTKTENLLWWLLHKTSFVPARGLQQLRALVKEGRIEAHLITARYASLTHDFEEWLKRIDADDIFTSHHHNERNEQPHEYKKRLIESLQLDVFIDDNWDIVRELTSNLKRKPQPKIFWITNLLDRYIPHEHKYGNLRGALKKLRDLTDRSS